MKLCFGRKQVESGPPAALTEISKLLPKKQIVPVEERDTAYICIVFKYLDDKDYAMVLHDIFHVNNDQSSIGAVEKFMKTPLSSTTRAVTSMYHGVSDMLHAPIITLGDHLSSGGKMPIVKRLDVDSKDTPGTKDTLLIFQPKYEVIHIFIFLQSIYLN